MKPIRHWLAFAVVMFAAGCSTVTTQFPVGSTTGLSPDPALIGTWLPRDEKTNAIPRTADGKIAAYIHVVPRRDGTFDIIMVSLPAKPDEKGDIDYLRATTGQAGANHFLNVVRLSPPGEKPSVAPLQGTIPIFYRLEANGDLALFRLDADKTATAIRAGAIAGRIDRHTYQNDDKDDKGTLDIVITADPAALDVFMAKPESLPLFEQMGVLKKAD